MKDLPDGRSTLGGNAPVMTKRFIREGVSVLLISSISPSLKNELSSDVQGVWFLIAIIIKLAFSMKVNQVIKVFYFLYYI